MRLDLTVDRHLDDKESMRSDTTLLERHGGENADSYVRFYADRQDQIIKGDPDTWEKVNRVFQFEWLRDHSLRPQDRFLDYGCGTASAGKHMIEFLRPQKYVGVDISATSIERGWEILVAQGLHRKGPMLHHIPEGRLDVLEGLAFDVIWAQSVFTHCPPEVIRTILGNLKRHMHPGTRFFASISSTGQGIAQRQLHNWYYDLSFFENLAPECGLKVSAMDDWRHPYEHTNQGFARSVLLQFTLA